VKKHSANFVTLVRIIGACAILFITPYNSIDSKYASLILFLFLAITDKLDGVLARSKNFGQITDLGKLLDPMADKLLVLIYLPLIEMKQITPGPVALLFARDIIISGMRQYAGSRGIVVAAMWSGKIKTFIAFSLAFILLARPDSLPGLHYIPALDTIISFIQSWPQALITVLIWSLVIVTLVSFIEYSVNIYKKLASVQLT